VRRAGPALVERGVARPRLVERQPFPQAEAQLLEGRVRLDLETVRCGNRRGSIDRAPERARVDGGKGMLLELAGGGFGLDDALRATPDGLDGLKASKAVASLPKDSDVVLYCGCCPMTKCPNIRPSYQALKEMGFTRIRVLSIPTNMAADWYGKDYPSEAGTAGVPGQ